MDASPTMLRRALAISRRLFTPLALAFLLVAAYSAREVVGQVLVQSEPRLLALVVVLWSALHLITPVMTWAVLQGLDVGIGYREALSIHMNRLPARYLPGGIWQTLSRLADLHDRGVRRPQLATLVAVENLMPLAMSLVLGGIFVWLAGPTALPWRAIILAGASLALLLPWLLGQYSRSTRLPVRHYLLAIAASTGFWLAAASLFALYWSAFPSAGEDNATPSVYGIYLLSWAAGFVAVFAPQGLGVFEAVAGLMLKGSLPFAALTLLLAGFRAATLAGDGLAYLAWHALRAITSRSKDTLH